MNKVILIGNLTRKPELKDVKDLSICEFTIAINGQKDRVDYIDCVAWNKLAETITNHLDKGSKVSVVGRLAVDTYEVEGKKRKNTQVVVEAMEFLSPKKELEFSITTESQIGSQIDYDSSDLPW